MTPKRTGPPLSSQLRRLDPPAKVLLIKMEALKPPRTPQGLTVTILPYSRVEEMTEREFTEMAESHDCILLDPDDPKMTHRIWCEEKTRLASSTGQPTLKIVYLDGLDYL